MKNAYVDVCLAVGRIFGFASAITLFFGFLRMIFGVETYMQAFDAAGLFAAIAVSAYVVGRHPPSE